MSLRLALPLAAALAAGPAVAQQFYGMEYDQPLNMALQEMLGGFGYACQAMGDPNACGAFNYVQQVANYMVGASNACLQGNQYGCQDYQMAYRDIEGTWMGYSQMVFGQQPMPQPDMSGMDTGGMMAPVNPLGETHADRMGAIAQFGADNTAAFNQRMSDMDANMAQWQSTN